MHYRDCVKEILGRLSSYDPLQSDSLEAMRNEYIVAILHAGLHIAKEETNKKLNMCPQYGIAGEDSKGRIDYAIKNDEDLICITENKQHKIPIGIAQNIKQLESAYETNKKKRKRGDYDFDYIYGVVTTGKDWQFLLYAPKTILKGNKLPYKIELTDDALVYNSVEYRSLCKDVKKILGIIVGLLKDRACVDNSPEAKRIKFNSYLLKE